MTWQDTTPLADVGAAYQAPNRAQNLRAYFTPDSLRLVPRTTTGPAWRLNLAVTGYGSGGATQRVAGAKLETARNGVQYERGDLVEWYVWGASSVLYHAYASAAPNTTNGGHWGYLKLNSDAARLQYVVLEGGGSRRSPMLYVDAAAPVLEDLTIRGSGGAGLLAVDALSLTLYNVQTASNVGDGIQLRGGDHYHIISATAQYNQGHGLRLEDAGHVVVTGTTLARNARGYGVWSADNATSLVFQDNTVAHNAYAARLPLAHQVGDSVWTGNRVNRIDVPGGELDVDSTWAAPLPYRIAGNVTVGANTPATLTLPPGAHVLFAEDCGLYVEEASILSAVGTLTAPITLERADPDAQWEGVDVHAGIPQLSYVTIRGASYYGLDLTLPYTEDIAVDHLTLAGNDFGLYVRAGGSGGSFTVWESNFVANRDGGLNVGASYHGVVTATYNYWNSPTGPYHDSLNPLGTGDRIAGTGVTQETFTPYLRRPAYLGSLSYDVVNLTPVDHTVLNFVEHNGVYTYTRAYPDGRQVVFDTEGRHLYTLEADGRATVYTYDSYDGLLATIGIVTPGGNLDAPTWVWFFGYNDDKLAYISYNGDTVAAFDVDIHGNLQQVIFPDDSTRRFYYDERGLLTQQVDPLGQVTGYGYDQYGRLAQSIAPATTVYTPATGETAMFQTVRTFAPGDSQGLINPYPAPGTPVSPASAAPTSTLLVDGVTYADGSARTGHTNAWGQWTDQTDALGRTTVYTRDANNNLTGLVQPEGDCVVATYDAAGRPTYAARMGAEQCALPPEQRNPAQMQSTAFTYEARYGQVKTQTDALGQTTVYTYDYELALGDAGKLAQIAYPPVQDEAGVWVTPVVSYTYNALRLLAEETARDGTVTRYTYTTGDEGECWWWEDEGTIPCFAPDVTPAPGLRAQVVRISGDTVLTTTYTAFDAQGRAQTTVAPDGSRTHTLYDVMGRVSATISAVGVTTDRTYDAAGRLVATTVQRPDDPIAVVTEYVYDAEGRQIATRSTSPKAIPTTMLTVAAWPKKTR
ncbi:MAG: right-handed parallel beta-helix repeat-containing protein [Anaerolineae bacterium]